MNEKTDQLNDWEFKVDEISANVYRIRGIDREGRSVERTGSDPEMLLSECKADAMKLSGQNKECNGQVKTDTGLSSIPE